MNIAEPKCPNCGKNSFATKNVPSISIIEQTLEIIANYKYQSKEAKTETERTRAESKLKQTQKKLDKLLANRGGGIGLVIFCINCGNIIGTGAATTSR